MINDLQIGKAGEYLVCADLIMKECIAFPSEQGLPFDVVLSTKNRLYKLQVKTTRQPQPIPQRKNRTETYMFHIRRCGKGGRKSYEENDVDIFALVALDTKIIGYIRASEVKQTMLFLPENGIVAKKKHGGISVRCKKLSEYTLDQCLK